MSAGPSALLRAGLPERIGKYQVLRRLAVGGMAEVFLGRLGGADDFSKQVVIKRVLPHHLLDHAFVTMFRDEARITSQLTHGNIVQVLEFAEEEGTHYLVMELVDGPSLAGLLSALEAEGRLLSVPEVAHVGAAVARALDYAHRKKGSDAEPLQIVHRDVSPSNVLLSREGEVKLTDFGIARARSRLTTTSKEGLLKGKIAYLAPETIRTGAADPRSDLFALGAVLYEMLTGLRAYDGATEATTIHRIINEAGPSPRRQNPAVPEALDALVLSLLARAPEQRPVRGLDVAQALSAFQDARGEELLARTITGLMALSEEPREEAPTPSVGPPSTRQTSLLVASTRTVRAVMKKALAARSNVVDAATVEEALSLLGAITPALIVTQRVLGESSGLELCRQVRAMPRLAAVPLVLLASDLGPELASEAAAVGVTRVMETAGAPHDIDDFLVQLVRGA